MKHRSFDFFGNVAVVNFPYGAKQGEGKKFAEKLMKSNKSIKTVLEKTGKFSGRLRKMKTKFVAGENTKEVLYRENGCVFRFNIDKTYFSPRLSNERKEIASKIKKGDNVLVMFAGVAPFSIAIAKNSKAKKVYSNEINREANKYAQLNIGLNNLKNKVELIPGDIKRVARDIGSASPRRLIAMNRHSARFSAKKTINSKNPAYSKFSLSESRKFDEREREVNIPNKFDAIIMPRPQLKETFLEQAFMLAKKGTRIYYYDFSKEDEIEKVVERIKKEAKIFKKRIKILKIKRAGEIGPYKLRIRVDFEIV